jgi:DNA polymerase-3 subunit delta'
VKLSAVVGHARVVARLGAAAARGRVPHAVLVLGPAGVGKRAVADAFAARLLCDTPVGVDACGTCAQCTRVAAGTHPDLQVVVRESERRDIRIEQVRELARWLGLQPLMTRRKIAIVDEAQCLNESAQNALLKTLEEPPPSSVLVLLSTSAALMLPTVRSRCQVLRLDPLSADAVVTVLVARGLEPARAARLAPLAEGAPGRVLALEAEAAARARERVLAELPRLAALDAPALGHLAQDLARGPSDAALATALAWYRDVLHAHVAGDAIPPANADVAAAVREAAAGTSVPRLLRQLTVVCDTIDGISRNANRTLALETMLLRLRAVDRGDDIEWTGSR